MKIHSHTISFLLKFIKTQVKPDYRIYFLVILLICLDEDFASLSKQHPILEKKKY